VCYPVSDHPLARLRLRPTSLEVVCQIHVEIVRYAAEEVTHPHQQYRRQKYHLYALVAASKNRSTKE
jgi:hypothetical protein